MSQTTPTTHSYVYPHTTISVPYWPRPLILPRYGQMTAGSYCYIGPQGIVHGTTVRRWHFLPHPLCCPHRVSLGSPQLTVMNASRKLGLGSLAGRVFLTSGLGGMSGAQAKASVIAGCVGVIAEVSALSSPSHLAFPPRSPRRSAEMLS